MHGTKTQSCSSEPSAHSGTPLHRCGSGRQSARTPLRPARCDEQRKTTCSASSSRKPAHAIGGEPRSRTPISLLGSGLSSSSLSAHSATCVRIERATTVKKLSVGMSKSLVYIYLHAL
eukprot:4502366-Pleurochrysis_carterae.AAC.2